MILAHALPQTCGGASQYKEPTHERRSPFQFQAGAYPPGHPHKNDDPRPATANVARLTFEMYAEPSTSFGDIAQYFAENNILIYGKELKRGFISQLLRNPIYAQADLDLYEFFKGQGAVVVNDAADFAGTNGCYLYQGRGVQERKNKDLRGQILVLAPSEGIVPADT